MGDMLIIYKSVVGDKPHNSGTSKVLWEKKKRKTT